MDWAAMKLRIELMRVTIRENISRKGAKNRKSEGAKQQLNCFLCAFGLLFLCAFA
jgi:hypothetical protein